MAISRWFQELLASPRIYPKSISILVIATSPCNSQLTHSKSQICPQTSLLFRFRFMNQRKIHFKTAVIRAMKKCQFQMDSVTTTSQTYISQNSHNLQLKLKTRCVSHGLISLAETQSLVENLQVAEVEDREKLTKKCFKDNVRQTKSIQNLARTRTIKSPSFQLPVTRMLPRRLKQTSTAEKR